MKKLMLFFALFASLFVGAQSFKLTNNEGYVKSRYNQPSQTDTITNTTPELQLVQVDGFNDGVYIQPTVTKISGTVAGTMKLQGSVDGVAYTDIASQTTTLTDVASQTAFFKCEPSQYRWYRISVVGSGTMSAKLKTPIIVRRR